MGKVGGKSAGTVVSADIVTHRTSFGAKEFLAFFSLGIRRYWCGIRLLALDPFGEFLWLHDLAAEQHVSVGIATELGALPVIMTDFVGLDPHVILASRH